MSASNRPKRSKRFVSILATLGCGYLLLLACGWALQRRLLYFPTKLDVQTAKAFAAQQGFSPWPNPAGEIIGWKISANLPSIGSVLVVHGNAGCALDRAYIARPIHDAGGLDVYVMEYPGYGMRQGSPSKTSWLQAAEAAFAELPPDKPIYVVSESIGAGAAAHLARTHASKISGMVLFVPFDHLPSLAQSKMPLLLPYFFLADRYAPAADMKAYLGPVKVVLGERDQIIPPKFGKRLFAACAGPKELQIIPGAGHNDVAEQPAVWWRSVFEFWRQRSGRRE